MNIKAELKEYGERVEFLNIMSESMSLSFTFYQS